MGCDTGQGWYYAEAGAAGNVLHATAYS
jgi:hypothetical protein